MATKEDLKKYPVYEYFYGKLIKLTTPPTQWNIWEKQMHHYIKQQQVKRHPELEENQKLFFLPAQMHIDLHNCIRNFEQKWGISRKELLYGAKYD